MSTRSAHSQRLSRSFLTCLSLYLSLAVSHLTRSAAQSRHCQEEHDRNFHISIVTCMAAGQVQQMTMQSGLMHRMCPAGRSSATLPKTSGR